MSIRIYNTLTRRKEPFEPVNPPQVGIYVCGPTVYKPSHIGHMVGPVIFDAIKRFLKYRGHDVRLVINITDVDDKLIAEAETQNTTVKELAGKVTANYLDGLAKLGVEVDEFPHATENIDEIQQIIQGLIDKGHAYAADGDVYFNVATDADYGKLSNRRVDDMEVGARIDPGEHKANPHDFTLWKAAKPGEPQWDSPWGPGRPGWHIECSAMSMKCLGETFDIHGGGVDLVFPHHENEVAQSECFTGKPFAKYWMHNGLTQLAGDKMSKSKGNLVRADELLDRYGGETIRFFLLSTHYRRPIDFSDQRIQEVAKGLAGFYRFFERFERITGDSFYDVALVGDVPAANELSERLRAEVRLLRERFLEYMDDDFNTGGATGALFELLTALNRFADQADLEGGGKTEPGNLAAFTAGAGVVRELASVLGVFQQPVDQPQTAADGLTAPLLDLLIEVRQQARAEKMFALADLIRDRLKELSIVLEDHPAGTTWRRE